MVSFSPWRSLSGFFFSHLDSRLFPDTATIQQIQDQRGNAVTDHHGIPDAAHTHVHYTFAEPQCQEAEDPQSGHVDGHGHFCMAGPLKQSRCRIVYTVRKAPERHNTSEVRRHTHNFRIFGKDSDNRRGDHIS